MSARRFLRVVLLSSEQAGPLPSTITSTTIVSTTSTRTTNTTTSATSDGTRPPQRRYSTSTATSTASATTQQPPQRLPTKPHIPLPIMPVTTTDYRRTRRDQPQPHQQSYQQPAPLPALPPLPPPYAHTLPPSFLSLPRPLPQSLYPHPIPNSYWVTPLLLASEYPWCPSSSTSTSSTLSSSTPTSCPTSPPSKLDALLLAGIRTFIDLTESGELLTYAPHHLLARATALSKSHPSLLPPSALPSISYHRFPIPDRSVPPSPYPSPSSSRNPSSSPNPNPNPLSTAHPPNNNTTPKSPPKPTSHSHCCDASLLPTLLTLLLTSLSASLPTVIHCRGGIGRTGTIVGCFLVESGLAPTGDHALDIIAAEWGTVEKCWRFPRSPETGGQAEFVRGFRRLGVRAMVDRKMMGGGIVGGNGMSAMGVKMEGTGTGTTTKQTKTEQRGTGSLSSLSSISSLNSITSITSPSTNAGRSGIPLAGSVKNGSVKNGSGPGGLVQFEVQVAAC